LRPRARAAIIRRATSGLDHLITGLGDGGAPLPVVLAVALLLGLWHATDPDHLVAVSTLVAIERDRPLRRAALLGLSWGLGHAGSLLALGLPIVLFGRHLPDALQRAAEALVGVAIMALAVRLLLRWRSGRFHAHEHAHGKVRHRHLHGHEHAHGHEHGHALARSPIQAFAVGLVHGVGGSAVVGVLLLASIRDHLEALLALLVFASATAASMAALSSALGYTLTRGPIRRRLPALAPALGALSLAFGAWYALAALGA
jgi:ABC-type nickel/cobalt efflux system permease component RcnA